MPLRKRMILVAGLTATLALSTGLRVPKGLRTDRETDREDPADQADSPAGREGRVGFPAGFRADFPADREGPADFSAGRAVSADRTCSRPRRCKRS